MRSISSSIIIFLFSSIFFEYQSNPFDSRSGESLSNPKFTNRNVFSDTGYFTIEWNVDSKPSSLFLLSEKKTQILYSGNDHLSTLSGLPSGKFNLVVCPRDTSFGEGDKGLNSLDYQSFLLNHKSNNCYQIQVVVDHHSKKKSFIFFGTGAFLFISILGLILFALKKEQI